MSPIDPSAPARRILLADADAFFAAVARLVDPEGAGRARLLIVGGAPGSRGVVCSASYEARQFGVRSAMPISRALRLCPDALCVPVPRAACSKKSREIAATLERFAPVVECASIDEWYLDLTGTERLYAGRTIEDVALAIRAAVLAETGLTVSLGGGMATGKATMRELRITKRVDKSSTALMSALRSNELIKEATLTLRKIGKTPLEYLIIKIEEGRVMAIDLEAGDTAGSPALLERVSFSFNKISIDYTPQGADGMPQGSTSFQDEWTTQG